MTAELSKIRNIGIAAHIDAGKTTTTERILFFTGKTHRMGDVDDGTTITDFDSEEQKRGITIYSAAVCCPWRGHTINLIDTPGHVDFTAEVERSLRVLDGMIAVFDGKEGVEAQSETVWRQADKYDIPRICFINKLDRVGADFELAVRSIKESFDIVPLVVQWPIGSADTFRGLIDLIDMKALVYERDRQGSAMKVVDVPEPLAAIAGDKRRELIETLAECDDVLMESYLQDAPITPADLRSAVRRAVLSRRAVPMLCGSSLRYIGVQPMLDAVTDYLPSPLDVPPIRATDAHDDTKTVEVSCDPDGPLATLVFKIVAEKPVDLYYLRIYSGTLRVNMRLVDSLKGHKENISQIYRMFAKRRDQIREAGPGEIVAVVGPKKSLTGHTLCDQKRPVILESIDFPETVISVSVEPKSSRDREKLLGALSALERQDPTISVSFNEETGQTLLAGMGELHLEVSVQRLRTDMNVEMSVGKPRVSYRETIAAAGEGEARFCRQAGGREHLATVRLGIEPRPRSETGPNFAIIREIPDGAILPEHLAALEVGITDAAQSGILGGYPVIEWTVRIVGVEEHQRDSSEMAFENAGRQAFYAAMQAASPSLLQPIMAVEVVAGEEHLGVLLADLNSRHATLQATTIRGKDRVIHADVPLSQMFGYVTRLRSLSQGRATSVMTPSHYAEVPAAEQKVLVG